MICAACSSVPNGTQTFLGMEPGPDGKAWWLCDLCWRMGVRERHIPVVARRRRR